ncbi:MAG: S-layer homology domain-containing protein [Firmicutes bacterium]|nr:S-layer homology domain-containing protein [Bacillota bacterium]
MKKCTYIMLMAALLALLFATAALADEPRFSDLEEGAWYVPYVNRLVDQGIINGFADGTVRPEAYMSFGEALKLVMQQAGYGAIAATGEHWASGYMAQALEDGLLDGMFDCWQKEYNLDRPFDRLSMAQLLLNTLEFPSVTTYGLYIDCEEPAAGAMYAFGIMEGSFTKSGHRVFEPYNSLTRAEGCTVLCRVQDFMAAEAAKAEDVPAK